MKYKDIIKCPKNNAPNEKMKSLEDWTLREIKEYCSRDSVCCEECKLDTICDKYFAGAGYIPKQWNIVNLPKPVESTIKWHKYPEDMPTAGDTFDQVLIVTKNGVRNEYRNTLTPCVIKGITAWAELPDIPLWDGD